jgi:hypothetical protein
VLGDPNGARGGAHRIGGLLGAKPDHDPYDQRLALDGCEQLQQLACSLGEFPFSRRCSGAVT